MKFILPFLFLSIWLGSCREDPQQFVVKGRAPLKEMNGKEVLLTLPGKEGPVMARAKVRNGKFEMQGRTDSCFIALLRVDMEKLPYLLPVAIEPGYIYVKMGEDTYVGGTPVNERLQDFMLAKDDFCSVRRDSFPEQFKVFVGMQVEKNKDCPPLAFFLRSYYGKHSFVFLMKTD